jgi:hypothetical protein
MVLLVLLLMFLAANAIAYLWGADSRDGRDWAVWSAWRTGSSHISTNGRG